MRATTIHAPRDIRVSDVPDPRVGAPTDAVVEVVRGCICGSDLWPYRGENPVEPGSTIGHECIGIVREVGDDVRSFSPGDFVIVPFDHCDNTCVHCRAGAQNGCVNLGFTVSGQAQLALVDQAEGSMVRTDGMPDESMYPALLALSDVMPTGWHAAVSAGVREGGTAVVVGDGAVGLCGVLAASTMGAERVVVMSRHASRQRLAREFGATDVVDTRGEEGEEAVRELTDGVGADSVLECVGTKQSMDTAFKIARPGSTVGFVGVPHGVELPVRTMFRKNVGLAGGMAPVRRYLPALLELVTSGRIDPGKVFDATVALDDVAEGYRMMDQREAIKVVVTVTDPGTDPGTDLGTDLVLGPLVRHVDEDSAVVWVETEDSCTVTVRAGEVEAAAATFAVHGHHYALVDVAGLPVGAPTPYEVRLDGVLAWPPRDSPYPAPVLATLGPEKPLRLAFGSCRTSIGHGAEGNGTHGVDALRAYALRMAGTTSAGEDDPDHGPDRRAGWPDMVLFLGDQVYADETTEEMARFIRARRDIEQAPWTELADYQEYAELYRLAWSDPANRWLLSTLPSLMIFDDHDIRDDWNTSWAWKHEMEATDWWHGRIVAGLGSYWVYQHAGNLPPEVRAEDPLWRLVAGHAAAVEAGDASGELDLSAALDELADRADQDPTSYRWSFARDFGSQARLVVVDSRAARVLEPEGRSLIDDEELAWLDDRMWGDVDHLLVGTSLPFLLAPGLHHVEAFSEALAGGAWGERGARAGERIRQRVDLEHWAAFQDGFSQVAHMTAEVASGERGRAPSTVTFLSGDVHHSYVSEAVVRRGTGHGEQRSRIIQAVCSPIRNPLPRRWRFATAVASYGVAGPIGKVVSRSAKVPSPELRWGLLKGPWFDNNLATLEVTERGLRIWWASGRVVGGDHAHPVLERVADLLLDGEQPGLPGPSDRARRWRQRAGLAVRGARRRAAERAGSRTIAPEHNAPRSSEQGGP